MLANLGRSYKRWQNGEKCQLAQKVMKHFFPSGHTSTGLNRRAKIQTVPLYEASAKALAARRPENETRSILLALKCNLPKEQYLYCYHDII